LHDYINAKRYFETAKALLENLDFSRPEVFNLYEKVQKNLEYLWSLEMEYSKKEEEKKQERIVEEDLSEFLEEETIEEDF